MKASEQIFRCYPAPEKKKKSGAALAGHDIEPKFQASSEVAEEINRIGFPWAGPMLIFDCETLTGAKDGQGLRFGCFQERGWRYDWRVADAAARDLEPPLKAGGSEPGASRSARPPLASTLTREKLDTLWHEGMLYEPKNCTPEEIEVLKRYAKNHKLELYTREYFVKNVLYRSHWVKKAAKWKDELREPCLVIGQNLPFDLGALAIHCGLAIKDLYGGLSLKMQGAEGEYGRSVAIKKIGFGKHLFRGTKTQNGCFTASGKTGEDTLSLSSGRARTMELVEFLDTQTLARALLGPGPSGMQALLDRLNIPKEYRKETADYYGPIMPEYIGYCRSDVENTWQIFRALRELYNKHGRSRPMQKIYSEASLGKAYLDDFGIQGFNKLNPAFDQVALGCFMESYYGGRSDVHVRHESVEVIHHDFKAEYSTVNALMGLQELLTAKQIGLKTDSPEAKAFLENVTLDDLQKKETWLKLRGVALIAPDDDILPFRAQYGEIKDGTISVNIGVNRVISACPAWYTFADIIASTLLTGRTPKILKTLELYAIGRQITQTIKLFGDDRYKVDLSKDDFFATVIDARIDVQDEIKQDSTSSDRKSFLSSLEKALKLLASAVRNVITYSCRTGRLHVPFIRPCMPRRRDRDVGRGP
jgi:hypothetical protein